MNVYPDIDLIEKKNETKQLLDEEYHQYISKTDEIIDINFPVTD